MSNSRSSYSNYDEGDAGEARAIDNAKKRIIQLRSLPQGHPEKDDELLEALEEFIKENE